MPIAPVTAEDIRLLSSGRWMIPILAAMAAEQGSRFSVLARRLAVSRPILARHLDRLEQLGWIARNPGHGHPLRPEYLLTQAGRRLAPWCGRVIAERQRLALPPTAFGRWSLPLIAELDHGHRRFAELQRGLLPITPRALSLALTQLSNADLVMHVAAESLYGLAPPGREFAGRILACA